MSPSVGMWDFELARRLFGKQIGLGFCAECQSRLNDIYLWLSVGKGQKYKYCEKIENRKAIKHTTSKNRKT
jgi:hypothetical protein